MSGHLAGIFRHPIKGFTPEPLTQVDLAPGEGFPFDRVWAVENGPTGFDPAAPAFVPKQKFAVLAAIPKVAAVRTRLHEATGALEATAPGMRPFAGDLSGEAARSDLAAWLTEFLGDEAPGPLEVLAAPETWRFTDHPRGQVSIVNLASVADLSRRMGIELDPLRFRANLYVEGWPAWAEHGWEGRKLMLGWAEAEAEVFKSIVRCVATHVNPETAAVDADVTKALFDNFGHTLCGVYARITRPGRLSLGDACTIPQDEPGPEPAAP